MMYFYSRSAVNEEDFGKINVSSRPPPRRGPRAPRVIAKLKCTILGEKKLCANALNQKGLWTAQILCNWLLLI